MGKPVCLMGHMHVCPVIDPGPKPHIGGPVISAGQSFVRYNGIPVAVVGGKCTCTGMPGPDSHAMGSTHVRISGKGVMRIGDTTGHGGKMVTGMPTLRAD